MRQRKTRALTDRLRILILIDNRRPDADALPVSRAEK